MSRTQSPAIALLRDDLLDEAIQSAAHHPDMDRLEPRANRREVRGERLLEAVALGLGELFVALDRDAAAALKPTVREIPSPGTRHLPMGYMFPLSNLGPRAAMVTTLGRCPRRFSMPPIPISLTPGLRASSTLSHERAAPNLE